MSNSSPTPRSPNPRSPCPELEDLAAFADGALPGSERAVIEEHLAHCDRCLEVVSETLHFVDQEATETGAVRPFRLPRALVLGSLGAVAAAVLAVVGIGLWRSSNSSYDLDAIAARLEPGQSLDQGLGSDWPETGWTVMRGSAIPISRDGQAAFRLGAMSLDVALGVRQRDPLAARGAASQIGNLETHDDVGALLVPRLYADQIFEALRAEPPAWPAAEQSSRELIRGELAEPLETLRVLGQWAQAARFASLLGDDAYFRSRPWRNGLADLDQVELSDDAARSREQLSELAPDQHNRRLELLPLLFKDLGG